MVMKFSFYALKLSLIIFIVFIIQVIFSGFSELFILNEQSFSQFWRFLTSIFLHADLLHLLYNLFALALFGSILESLVGKLKFLVVFFVSGILANLVSINFYSNSLGASGAIFGIIGALIMIRPTMFVWAFGLPMPIFVAGILWAVGDFIGAVGYLSGNPINNTGNIAHLSGMFFGFIFGLLFRNKNTKNKKLNYGIVMDERYMRDWEERNLK